MATEDDKTNTGVAGTAIAVGVAAMIAGSTALVGMARTEVDEWSQGTQAYADLASVKALKSEQSQQLSGAKVSIDKARQLTLANLKRDPDQASPWTPKPPPPEASTAASTEAATSGTDTMASTPVASQTAASPAVETAPTAAVSETATAPSPTATH